MRRRILAVALSAVLVAVVLFGVPLAVAVQRTINADERGELERLALRAAVTVSPDFDQGDPAELPATESAIDLAVYGTTGQRVTGSGPVSLGDTLGEALTGRVVEQTEEEDFVVLVPVSSGEQVIGVVRAASPRAATQARVWWTWAAMGGLALLAAAGAGILAAALSRKLARPLTEMTRLLGELGDGNFALRAEPSAVPELDNAAASLNRTAERLSDLIARERAFSAHASHQLRTPLTALRLQLETGLAAGTPALEGAATAAIQLADQLSMTIDDVLDLARGQQQVGDRLDVGELLDEIHRKWNGPLAIQDRPLRVVLDDPPASMALVSAVRQVLDVLVDNAYRHGHGIVSVRARGSGGALAIDVTDEGMAPDFRLPPKMAPARLPDSSGRLGLSLACSLAESAGGRILLTTQPTTRVTLVLPPPATAAMDDTHGS